VYKQVKDAVGNGKSKAKGTTERRKRVNDVTWRKFFSLHRAVVWVVEKVTDCESLKVTTSAGSWPDP
jgi:hypothetical protein